MYLDYEHLSFRYEPFPIGVARPVMGEELYRELLASYPPLELFQYFPKVGHKYSLSEKYNAAHYRRWIRQHGRWRDFHRWLKGDDFLIGLVHTLSTHYIDLGFDPATPAIRRILRRLRDAGRGRTSRRSARLRTRFEFSMLPADGGHVLPHTDSASKVVTLILSMVGEHEWNADFGGGTDVNVPRHARFRFNQLNRQARFEDMEIVDSYPFSPNQAVVFVKTFNSWHSVRPMSGKGSDLMRRTLTINIEAGD